MDFTATQTVLTIAFNTVSVTAIAFITTSFVIEAVARWQAIGQESQRPQDVEQLQDDIVTGDMQPVDDDPDLDITLDELQAWDQRLAVVASRPTMEDRIVPFVRPQRQPVEDYSTWTVAELRSLFNSKGLAWRNAGADGKHLRKQEMLNRLIEVNAA